MEADVSVIATATHLTDAATGAGARLLRMKALISHNLILKRDLFQLKDAFPCRLLVTVIKCLPSQEILSSIGC